MTVNEIITKTKADMGIPISTPFAIRYINAAMQALANMYDTACVITETVIDAFDKDIEYPIVDCIGVLKVTRDNDRYIDYTVDFSCIRFRDEGEYTVRYLTYPRECAGKESVPGIHPAYHECICLYIAAMANRPRDENLLEEFYTLANSVDSRLRRMKRRHLRLPRRLWR